MRRGRGKGERPMVIGDRASMVRMLVWQWRFVVVSGVSATAVWAAHDLGGLTFIELPTLPLAVVGAALGIFVSFRTNSSYDRWWEGRKLWGRMINTSRHFCMEVNRYLPSSARPQKMALVKRHVAYVHTLRCRLRGEDPLKDTYALESFTDEEVKELEGSSNTTYRLLDMQLRDIATYSDQELLNAFRLQTLDESLRHLLDIQGGCERIKKTPLPKIYGFISVRMIQWFGALMPAALVADLSWGCIPISMLVTLGFHFISETGRVLEDPFSTFYNGLPLSTISRMIEINVLEMMGEEELPAAHPPLNEFVIM
jgi:putative membrane protein